MTDSFINRRLSAAAFGYWLSFQILLFMDASVTLVGFYFFCDLILLLSFHLLFCEVCFYVCCDSVMTYHLVFPFHLNRSIVIHESALTLYSNGRLFLRNTFTDYSRIRLVSTSKRFLARVMNCLISKMFLLS